MPQNDNAGKFGGSYGSDPILDPPKDIPERNRDYRRLGHQDLWIDSLCIIQDNEEDWAREAASMAKVYSQAYCTLAALSSSDSNQGLNLIPPDFLVDMVVHDTDNEKYRLRFQHEKLDWRSVYNGSLDDSPLRYRAWAFQEKELSSRIVHFGKTQLVLECSAEKGSISDGERGSTSWKWTTRSPIQSSSSTVDLYDFWSPLVMDYAERNITKVSEKLLAFSGIAQTYQRLVPSAKYVAGMWSTHLPEGLLWQVWINPEEVSRRTSEYIAPSWSWASVMAPIKFRPCDTRRKLRVQEMWGLPKHNDAYGALVDASLILSDIELVKLNLEIRSPEGDLGVGILTRYGVIAGVVFLDVKDGLPPTTEDLIFMALEEKPESRHHVGTMKGRPIYAEGGLCLLGLVLRKVHQDDMPTYRRIHGLGRYVPESLTEGLDACTINLL